MDYNALLDFSADLGYRLAMSGAETFRVEDTINRITRAYGVESEVFAIPNCLHVSIETDQGQPLTRMRRIGFHGNDLDAVEQYNSLSRRICQHTPELSDAIAWLKETDRSLRVHCAPVVFLGYFIASMGYCLFFRGSLMDSFISGICGLLLGGTEQLLGHLRVNQFFRTILSSFVMSMSSYLFNAFGLCANVDAVIIGGLMALVPGLLFTNAMRDIIYGDTNSGINRIVQVLMVALGLALGAAVALNLTVRLFGVLPPVEATQYTVLTVNLACLLGSLGFSILFNIHGRGMVLCALGSCMAWCAFLLSQHLGSNDVVAYFFSAMAASAYSEIMARVRKCPATPYLVVSIFPLIPGAGVYYTMQKAVSGDMAAFASQGTHTAALAGSLAVGIILMSSVFRIISTWQAAHRK